MRYMYLFDFSMQSPIHTKVITDHTSTTAVTIQPFYLVITVLSTHQAEPAKKVSIIQKCIIEPM